MITGSHVILYTTAADADRAFLRDVLGFPHVDAGDGWLIFALPPAEIGVHPADASSHELFLMTDDVNGVIRDMKKRKVKCTALMHQPWGSLMQITLPGGSQLGIYQPRHPSPKWGKAKTTKPRAKPRKK